MQDQKKIKVEQYNPLIKKTLVDLDDGVIATCRHCRQWLFNLADIQYYMSIRQKELYFGEKYFVLFQQPEIRLKSDAREAYLEKQEPFHLMYLRPICCEMCDSKVGLYFQSVNILGNKWLFNRIAVDCNLVEFQSNKTTIRNDRLIEIIQDGLLKQHLMQKKDQLSLLINIKRSCEKEQHQLASLLCKYLDHTKIQNYLKGTQIRKVIQTIQFFDRRVGNTYNHCKAVVNNCERIKQMFSQNQVNLHYWKMKSRQTKPRNKRQR